MHNRHDMETIQRPLTRLRRDLRRWQLGVGASRLLGIVSVLTLLSLAVDRGVRMDHVQRLLALIVAGAVNGVLAWRWVIRPLRQRISESTLLGCVERLRPELKGRLLAAWEFAAMSEPQPGASAALVDAVIGQGVDAARNADFRGVLDWRRFRQNVRIGLAAVAVLIVVTAGAPQTMRTWFLRNVLLSHDEWPRRTHLQVEGLVGGVLQVPAAGDLNLGVRVTGIQPTEVVVRYQVGDAGAPYTEQMSRIGEIYRTVFRNVTDPFRLQIRGGDDQTGWIPVQLLPRPTITNLVVTIEPPAYTGLKPVVSDERSVSCRVPAGSALVLEGRANIPLRELEVMGDKVRVQQLSLDNSAVFSVRLPPEQVKTATYRFQSVSAAGVPALKPTLLALRVEPDRPPRVSAVLEGIGQLVLARAVVPVVCEFQDDYGVEAAWLDYRSQSPVSGSSPVLQMPIPLPKGRTAGGVIRMTQTLDLARLELETDATISLLAAARDGNTVSGPSQDQSGSFTLRVVTDDELRVDLARREQVLRERLEPIIREQSVLADESRLFHAGTEDLRERAAARALLAEKRQRQVAPALAAIVAGLAQIRDEAYQNRLEPPPGALCRRLEVSALTPLRDVLAGVLAEASEQVVAARRQVGEEERRAAWREAEVAQRRVAAALVTVRNSLLVSSDVSDLIRLMDDILNEQKRVSRETQRKAADAIENIFEKK